MRRVTFAECQKAVLDHFGISKTALLGDTRRRSIAWPRMILMVMAREFTGMTTAAVGRRLNRDHSTVIVNCRRVGRLCVSDPSFCADVDAIRHRLDLISCGARDEEYVQAVQVWNVSYKPSSPVVAPPVRLIRHKYL